MIGEQFVATSKYSDSEVLTDREVTFFVSTDEPVYVQIARVNPRDGSRIWELTDTPLPAIDISIERIAGIRFKQNGATPANIYIVWTFDQDDALISRFSTNGPFGSGGGVPSGPAGGDLAGLYPNPLIGAGKVTLAKIAAAVTLDAIATANVTAGDVAMNGHKLSGLAAATAPGDALRYEQLFGAPAGGDLTGTYLNPTIAASAVTLAKIAAAVTLDAIATGHATAANIPMNAKKLTGLAAGSTNGDSVRFEQLATAGTYPLTKVNVPIITAVNNTAVGLSFVIPGGTLGASSVLRIRFCITVSGTAGNYTILLSLGGTTIKTTTGTQLSGPTYNGEILLVCQNATNSQLWHYGALSGSTVWWAGASPIASAKDLTANQTIVLSISSSDVLDGGETFQFATLEVEP